MLDFNDIAPVAGGPVDLNAQRDELKRELLARLPAVLMALFPAGKIRGNKFLIGNIQGEAGDSLEIALDGDKAGLWHDHATGEGGDIFGAIAGNQGLDTKRDFAAVLEAAARLVGRSLVTPMPTRSEVPIDELGPHTAKWDYLSATGELIACVYRYDPEPGKKEFRPWDVRARMCRAPDPRPLYNLPDVSRADSVILVEGEKCADALIRMGITATTAMNGAKAPIDKTDWTPLAGKAVLIWPDRDVPGWDYAEAAARACVSAGAVSVAILVPPTDRPPGWDVADAVEEGFDVQAFLESGERRILRLAGRTDLIGLESILHQTYAADAGLSNLAFDLLRPVPVLNTLVKGSPALTSNQYFNMEFYQSFKMDVILPSVGQGYFYFGPWLAWLVPAALLTLGSPRAFAQDTTTITKGMTMNMRDMIMNMKRPEKDMPVKFRLKKHWRKQSDCRRLRLSRVFLPM